MNADRKVAVVTGASQGLGEGIVNALRERNYRVVGTSRSIKPSDDPDYVTVASDIGTGSRTPSLCASSIHCLSSAIGFTRKSFSPAST